MRAMRALCVALVAGAFVLASSPAAGQETPQALRQEIDQLRRDFEALKQQYGERLTALESKLAAAEGTPPPAAQAPATPGSPTEQVPPGAAGAGGPSGALPVYGAGTAGSKIFNPDIAVIGDFLGAAGTNDVNPPPSLEMHESEASFQAIVDPYARADFFVAFGEEGVELEEGYLTFTTLPGGLLTKVGKTRSAFGKVNTMHNHILPWTDRPLVTTNLLGGEEGLADAGVSVARLIPNPWLFLEATGQIYRGDSSDVFTAARRSDVSVVGRLRGYQDITESTNIDLGVSYARGHNVSGLAVDDLSGSFTTNLYGVDATVRWRPLRRAIYRSFVGRSEWIWSRRDQPGGLQAANGFFVAGDYQFARRWFAGVRGDRSGRATDATLTDTGQSLTLTFWPSEFSQLRGQYRRTRYALGPTANEFLFQFLFSIGAHGAHPF
jgi:hypothetical protein